MNFIKGQLFLFLILVSSVVYAKTHYLLLDVNGEKLDNSYLFYNDTRYAHEIIRKSGGSPQVYAKDGQWQVSRWKGEELSDFSLTQEGRRAGDPNSQKVISYPVISGAVTNAKDIEKAIENLRMQSGDKVVIQINGHGDPSRSPTDTQSGIVRGWGDVPISYDDFKSALARLPKGVSAKLITHSCYSGTIHQIARDLDNTCTATPTIAQKATAPGTTEKTMFLAKFWEEFDESSPKTFGGAALAALSNDVPNMGVGNVSSFDYVDWVLKTGQHDPKFRFQKTFRHIILNGKPTQQIGPGLDYNPSISHGGEGLYSSSDNRSNRICTDCCSARVQKNIDLIGPLTKTLNEITQSAVVADLSKKVDRQPAQIRTVFHDVIADMKKNGARYEQIAREYDQKFLELNRRWIKHRDRFAGSSEATKWFLDESGTRAQIQKEVEVLTAAAARDLKQNSFNHQMLGILNRLDKFNKKATPEQKRKFVQLLQCEWESL